MTKNHNPTQDKCDNYDHMRGQHKGYEGLAHDCKGRNGKKCSGFEESKK